ncbi:MAG: formylglycine-generating enzyme family protein [Fibrobacter sp.]|nr:formylglycine-generating enzyme family protein [Fibrobacter sp.]
MSFVRLFPILLLLPALTMADSDKNFKILAKHFKVGTVVDPIANMAVSAGKGVAVSEEQTFPLKENKIYLRHKVGPKEYQWISGKVNAENFKKLHAYSLKDNYLRAAEVATMRFYATKNTKAFQDEADIYFDREYIYSPRVPKMFFIKNGEWQLLTETTLPGIIKFSSDNKKLEISNNKGTIKGRTIFPVQPGVYTFVFSAPNALPYADIGIVGDGDALVFKPKPMHFEIDYSKKPAIDITINDIEKTTTLEETEVLYDKFMDQLDKATENLSMNEFESAYPKFHSASSLGLDEDNKVFKEYEARYNTKKAEAQRIWRQSKIGDVSYLNKALLKKLDELQQLPLRGSMMPAKVEPVFEDTQGESIAHVIAVTLRFGDDHGRFDVSWTGSVATQDMDRLFMQLKDSNSDIKVFLTLQNNKPVWIYKDGKVNSRHQYRYEMIDFQINGEIFSGQGEFILPDYILNEPEVQEWLNPKTVEEPVVRSSSSAMSSSSAADTVWAKDALMPSLANIATSARVVRDRVHGNVAMIDSGMFRYKGRVVSMSPFAIMTTEMTQKLFEQAMNTLDSTKRIKDRSTYKHPQKPVHNITWGDARFVCQTLGGDLPTEAQWEFAARADNNDGAIWIFDSIPDPGKYAVYYDNSYRMNSKSSEYGPQPASSKKPNRWGIYDMAGNVAEWTRDKYFMFSVIVEPSNPTGAMFGSSKVYKGGSWKDKEKLLNATESDDEDPRYWSESIGFRCVYPRDIIKE